MVIIQNISISLNDTAVFKTITEIITLSEEEHYKFDMKFEQLYLDFATYSFGKMKASVP